MTHIAVPVSFKDERRNDGMVFAFALVALGQYRHDYIDLFQSPSFVEHTQLLALVEVSSGGYPGPSGVSDCKKDVSDVVKLEADKEDWNFDGVMTAAEASGSDLRVIFRELRTKCRAVHTEVCFGLINVVKMANHCITFEYPQNKSDREFQNTQRK